MVACKNLAVFGLLALIKLVSGHGCITAATGDAGGNGTALGIDPSTPRDGKTKNPFEQDTTRFKGDQADTFGETLEGGDNDPETGTAAILAQNGGTLPQITAGGSVTMTLHQVNADGAGPYACSINSDATGTTWTQMTVTQQVAGVHGLNPAGSVADHPLAAAVPAAQTCTGTVAGQQNVCMVKCQNQALAGPFGGVVPVQLANNTAASTDTAASTSTSNNTTAADTGSADTTAANTGSADTTTDDDDDTASEDTAATTEAAAKAAGNKQKKPQLRRSSRIDKAAALAYRNSY